MKFQAFGGFDFEALKQANEGKKAEMSEGALEDQVSVSVMDAPAPVQTHVDFEPVALDLEQAMQAASPSPERLARVNRLEKQVETEDTRAQASPSPANVQVQTNLKKQLKQEQSEARAEALKALLKQLKPMRPLLEGHLNTETLASIKQTVMQVIVGIKSCYSQEKLGLDVQTMSVLQPLIQCQVVKWQGLKQDKPDLLVPPQEKALLKKLRSQSGSLTPVERVACFQVVLGINAMLKPFVTEAPAADAPPETPKSETSKPEALQPAEAASTPPASFDPLKAGRQILQLRAKLQRTRNPEEKDTLAAQLKTLLAQQAAHQVQYMLTALEKSSKSLGFKLKTLKGKYDAKKTKMSGRLLEKNLRQDQQKLVKEMEMLNRVLGRQKEAADLCEIFQSAVRQLARVGLEDAPDVVAREQKTCLSKLADSSCPKALKPLMEDWLAAFEKVVTWLLELQARSAWEVQAETVNNLFQELEAQEAEWQDKQQIIQALEQQYLDSSDLEEQAALRSEIMTHYAEGLAGLPYTLSEQL